MAASSQPLTLDPRSVALASLALGLLGACSVGQGTGDIHGRFIATDYEFAEDTDYDMVPTFFSAEVTEDHLNLRVQRGSDIEGYADGLIIHVGDVNDVDESRLGLPIALTGDYRDPVSVILYLNETCPSGFPDEFSLRPMVLQATGGAVIFDAIYAPQRDAARTAIEMRLVNVEFVDLVTPDERNATLDGEFSMFYQRGSPAQRFP